MRLSRKIILFLGAGASASFGYPTTKQFIDSLKTELAKTSEYQAQLLDYFLNLKGFADIEHVLELLDSLQSINKHPVTDLFRTYTSIINLRGQKINFNDFLNRAKSLRDKIQVDVFRQYEFNPDSRSKINEVYVSLFESLMKLNSGDLPVFTTNYDRVIENFCINNDIDFTDGFRRIGNSDEAIWDATQYSEMEKRNDKKSIHLFKLHGSLNWRERKDGKIVRVSPEEMTKGSKRYKRNLVIYPAEKLKPEIEPFKALHEMFLERFTQSNIVIFIGFAFRDAYLNTLFRQAPKKVVITILPHASTFLKESGKSIGFKNPIPIDAALGEDNGTIAQKIQDLIR